MHFIADNGEFKLKFKYDKMLWLCKINCCERKSTLSKVNTNKNKLDLRGRFFYIQNFTKLQEYPKKGNYLEKYSKHKYIIKWLADGSYLTKFLCMK